jgi:broad specificity phosphatase PhoE
VAALHDLMGALGSGETAAVFTSGGPIAALAADARGLPDSAMVAFNHVAINGGVSKLVGGRRGISLISFNEHAHLEQDGLVTYR